VVVPTFAALFASSIELEIAVLKSLGDCSPVIESDISHDGR
jgi:hypothetical protein